MHQLFYNLLNNALKFSKPDIAPAVRITCQKLAAEKVKLHSDVDGSQSYYEILVQDKGMGFNPESAEKIFGSSNACTIGMHMRVQGLDWLW